MYKTDYINDAFEELCTITIAGLFIIYITYAINYILGDILTEE